LKTVYSLLFALSIFISLFYNNCGKSHQFEGQIVQASVESIEEKIAKSPSGFLKVILQLKPESSLASKTKLNSKKAVIQILEKKLQNKSSKLSRQSLYTSFKVLPALATEIDRETLEALRASGYVSYIEEDLEMKLSMEASNRITSAEKTQALGFTGKGKTVAVIDTGVQYNHPGFGDRVIGGACYTSDCDSNAPINGGSTEKCSGTSNCKHGTHVAGIIAGDHQGLQGVAPEASIYSVRVFSADSRSTSTSNVVQALEDVLLNASKYNIVAVNLSLGGGKFSKVSECSSGVYYDVIKRLIIKGVAVIAATGNDSYKSFLASPACIPGVIRVASSTKSDTVSSFSNIANWASFLAPGSSILSFHNKSGTATASGTSMATPNLAGAYVVLKAAYPAKTQEEIVAALKYSANYIPTAVAVDLPRYDLYWAMQSLSLGLGEYTYDDSDTELNEYIEVAKINLEEKMMNAAYGASYHEAKEGGEIVLRFSAPEEGSYLVRLRHPSQQGPAKLSYEFDNESGESWLQIGESYTDLFQFDHKGRSIFKIKALSGTWHFDRIDIIKLDENQISLERLSFHSDIRPKTLSVRQPLLNGDGLITAHTNAASTGYEFHWYKDGSLIEVTNRPELKLEDRFGNSMGTYHLEVRGPSSHFLEVSEEIEVRPVDVDNKSLVQFNVDAKVGAYLQVYYKKQMIYEKLVKHPQETHNVIINDVVFDWEDVKLKVVADEN
jgi:subtilisin family serine protease